MRGGPKLRGPRVAPEKPALANPFAGSPLGSYNPDWAVLVENEAGERIYFAVETKSSLFTDDLRDKEYAKIKCAKAHFQALRVCEPPARYDLAKSVDDLMGHC